MKIGFFTDFHWGVNKNSTQKVAIGEEVMARYTFAMKEAGVEVVIFGGDWNHSRDFLHVDTQERARRALEKFAEHFKHVYIVVGNHDCHYKEHNDINSVEQFSRIPNVDVFKDYGVIHIDQKKIALCPWGFDPKPSGDIDVAFGHFDFAGAALVGAVNKGSYSMEKLTKFCKLCFSGHFHVRKEYETKHGKIVTGGCPYEQNWGDVGNSKGFYVIDTEDLSYTFHENTFSPRHVPVRWSKIREFDTSRIKGNYLRIVIDADYEYDKVVKVAQAFTKAGAISVEMDYQFQKELSMISEMLGDVTMMSHEEAINKYIDQMDINDDEREWIRPIAIALFKECSE